MADTPSARAAHLESASSLLPSGSAANSWDLPNAAKIFQTLRDAIGDPAWDPPVVLGAIAEAAHALTDASAAALAMRRNGIVLCVGRSGETAPELGAHLSIDSGISGECLRTGKILRCDDTQKDYRADPVVCLRLGLCSIAAVPLRLGDRVIGILEAFSTRPYAFAEEHMQALQKLARLAEVAYTRESGFTERSEPAAAASPSRLMVFSAMLLHAWETTAAVPSRIFRSPWRHIIAGAALGTVLLLSFVGWLSWHAATPGKAAQRPSVSAPAAAPEDVSSPVGATLAWNAKPSPASVTRISPAPGGVQQAAKVDKDTPTGLPPATLSKPLPTNELPPATESRSQEAAPNESAPPSLVASNADHSPIGNVLFSQPALPRFTTPVSEGVTEGILTHKVKPIYPAQALPLRLSGAVVLDATITEDGSVRDLNVVRGNLTLAQAAIDAVSQWRYKPYLLNGKPVAIKTQITIDFKVPQ